ncbi:MAG TPA: hypothetical protein VFJ95_11970 [Gammaproteobacteria bacterium]|jgi:hypothetical protein|nr:hypothetical protein [Gammaproteobacteria bacterium]
MSARSAAALAAWLLAAAALAAGLESAAVAQGSAAFAPARLWDGKTPDFRGIWRARGTAYVNIEGHAGGRGVAAAKSIVVDPPDGKIPYKADALARRNENYRARATADPSSKCYQAGVPRATYLATPLQILQSPGNFAIVYEENHAFRVFHPESRPHFDATDWWMGDTRYRWDGDTLVADVVAQTELAWLDQAGNFHSNGVHIVERYRMTGADTIEYEARIEDPDVYTRPWTLRTQLERVKEPGARIIEDECLDDENGVRHHVSPYDRKNLLKHDYSRAKKAAAN